MRFDELWSDLRYRVRALLRRDAVERELHDELRFHIEREAEKYVGAGLEPNEALRRARLVFGGVEYAKEASRESRGTATLESLVQDVRYAVRSLRRQPAFTAIVVLTLALGIGANAAIFSLVDALLLRTLPVPHPERLVTIGDPSAVNTRWTGSTSTDYVSYPLYVDVRDHNSVLSGLYANGSAGDLDVVIGHDASAPPEHPEARLVSGNFFSVLELPAQAGRTFTDDDDRPATPSPVAVLSYAYWQRRFGGDHAAIGSTFRVNGVPVTIIGVTPPQFAGDIVGQPTDLWMPIAMQPALQPRRNILNARQSSWLVLMGRLGPGVTLQQARAVIPAIEAAAARADLSGIALQRFDEYLRASPIHVEIGARGFSEQRAEYRRALILLMAAVALVILVVCANVANLMLARAVARLREMSLRLTLGAGRGRLVQQVLTESVLLAMLAGALGLFAAVWGSHLLLAVVGGSSPIVLDVTPNLRVLAFTGVATLLCVLLFGLVPALHATRVDLATALRSHGRSLLGASTRPGRVPLTKGLVIAQIALSTVLLIGSSLLVRSMRELLHVDLGMDRDHLVLAHVATSRTDYIGERLHAFEREALDRVSRVPGVDAASYSLGGPFTGGHSAGHVDVEGFVPAADSLREANYDYIGPGYFHALGAKILRGRDFASSDVTPSARVAAINETMAKFYLRDRDPIGRTLTLDSVAYTIVAVVHDVRYSDLRGEPVRRFYIPDAEVVEKPRSFEVQVHVRGDPARYMESVRQALLAADRNVPVEMARLDDRVRQSVAEDALLTQVTAFFGLVALLLAALGLYGVTAYATTQRTGEFGLRAALGAEPWRVSGMVLREAVIVAVTGVAVGIPCGLLAARALRGALFGVSAVDVPSLGVSVLTLIVTAVVASYLPAWRAAQVSPLEALRAER
jgi:predicted permease